MRKFLLMLLIFLIFVFAFSCRDFLNPADPSSPNYIKPPSDLVANAAFESTLDISWDDNSKNEDSFIIERKDGSGGTYHKIATVGADTTYFNDTSLTFGTTYYYRVKAHNYKGDSDYSNQANATPGDITPPADVTNLTATPGDSQVELTWTNPSDPDFAGLLVVRSVSTISWEPVDGTTYSDEQQVTTGVVVKYKASGVGYPDTELINETKYYYRIYTYDYVPNYSSGVSASATPGDTTPPETNITGGPSGTIGYDDVQFTWTGSDNVTATSNLVYSYYLNGYDSGYSPWTSSTSKNYYNLPNGPYTFYVKAKDEAGNIDPTPASKSFTVQIDDAYEPEYDLSNYEQTWLSNINGYGIQADDDWYKIYVTSGYHRVLIDCRFTDADGDIDIALYNSSRTTRLDRSVSTTNNEYIDYTVPTGGTYYIKVYYGNAGNTYNLWWDDIRHDRAILQSATPATYGTMTFSYSGAQFETYYTNPPHWKINYENGYMKFTFSGQIEFWFHALGSTSGGVSYCYVDVYVNGNSYWSNKFINKDWTWYIFPRSAFGSGTNTVKIVLRPNTTHFWIDEAKTSGAR